MTIPTVPVTCQANDQSGLPIAGATFTAKLNQTEIYAGFVVPEYATATSNESGIAVLNVWPTALGNQGSQYRVTATDPDTGKRFLDLMVSVPNSPCNLHQIIVMEPYPALDASAQALAAAQGALAQVTTQAGIATEKAVEAAAQAALATSSANNSQVSATLASAKAADASTSAVLAAQALNDANVSKVAAAGSATASALSASAAASSNTSATAQANLSANQASISSAMASAATDAATLAANSAATASQAATDAHAAVNTLAINLISTQAIVAQHHAFK